MNSHDGYLVAFGSADLSIQILTKDFKVIRKIPKAHGFPVTALTFSSTSKCIISGSADGTCVIASVPPPMGKLYYLNESCRHE
jgi:prolactin regulatory element-binding protein